MRTFAQTTSAKSEASRRSRVQQTRAASPIQKPAAPISNQVLQRMLRAHAETAKESERARSSGGLSPTHGSAPAAIQPKLTVNTPGDAHEQEADRVADEVMRMPEPGHSPERGRPTRADGQSGVEQVKTKPLSANSSAGAAAPPIVHDVLRSPGQPLDAATRAFMEPRFGRDFSDLRVHTDAQAAESAKAVNALAYTAARDIVFAPGQYDPGSTNGRRLLAHELTHVAQQGTQPMNGAWSLQREKAGGEMWVQKKDGTRVSMDDFKKEREAAGPPAVIQPKLTVNAPGDVYEQEADRVADAVMRMAEPESSGSHAQLQAGDGGSLGADTKPESAQSQKSSLPDGPCTFELPCKQKEDKIQNTITCCFVVQATQKDGKWKFHVTVTPLSSENPVSYENELTAVLDKDRFIIVAPLLKSWQSSTKRSDGKWGTILVDYSALEDALTKTFAPKPATVGEGATGSEPCPWDFIVLEVYDPKKQRFPLTATYWMGKSGSAPGKKTATYRVDLAAFLLVAGKNYFKDKGYDTDLEESTKSISTESLPPEQVWTIARGTSGPIKTSDKGFAESPFVGAVIANNPTAVGDSGTSVPATFDVGAGQELTATGNRWRSVSITVPYTLTGRFQFDKFKVPDDFEATSGAVFERQARFLLLWLAENPDLTITIHAHTDGAGSAKYNEDLSLKRALSAKDYLTNNKLWTGAHGIPPAVAPEQVKTVGEGRKLAEEELQKTNPTDWMKIIGTSEAAKVTDKFRRFDITYDSVK
ncbi:MAG TPA: DUF4157 domain-containing protein [Beijerinckiaceae bacterium]|jgi:outer membrane protein OmpA-like peptidoglycan-associated protein